MKRKYVWFVLLCLIVAIITAGCAKDNAPEVDEPPVADVDTDVEAEVDADVEANAEAETDAEDGEMNLEALFQQGMDSYTEKGIEPPMLFPETDIEYLENFYPGISYANIKQIYVAMAPVTNAPMEIALVEVADSSDVAAIRDIFQERIDARANDSEYPEESAVWKKNGIVTIRDNYIFMTVMTDDYGIPDVFILE